MEEQQVTYRFSYKGNPEKILEQMIFDIDESFVKWEPDNNQIDCIVYELDPDNGDNQSLYITEWIEKFPNQLSLFTTFY